MILLWEVIVVLSGVIGAIFNIYKKKVCFVIWTFHQLAWIAIAIDSQTYIVMLSPLFFIGTNFYGYRKWRKDAKNSL